MKREVQVCLGNIVPHRPVGRQYPSSSPATNQAQTCRTLSTCFLPELCFQSVSCLSPALDSQASDVPCVSVIKTRRRQCKAAKLFSLRHLLELPWACSHRATVTLGFLYSTISCCPPVPFPCRCGILSSGEPLVGHWSPVSMHEDSRLHLLCSFFLQATRASRPIPWVLDKYQLQFIKTVPIATAREPLPCTRLGAPHCADIISLCPAALPPAIFSSFVETLRRWWGKVMPKVTGLPVGARTSGQRNFKAGRVLSCEVHGL